MEATIIDPLQAAPVKPGLSICHKKLYSDNGPTIEGGRLSG